MSEKPQNQPEIKDGKLLIAHEEIDLYELAELLLLYGKSGIVEQSTDLAISLGEIASLACQSTVDPSHLKEKIPAEGIYFLRMLIKAFKD